MHHEFALIQDGKQVASAGGSDRAYAYAQIEHYAAVYSQDGPVQIIELFECEFCQQPFDDCRCAF